MKNILITIFGASYRTSILGLVGAIGYTCIPLWLTGTTDWKHLLGSAFIAAMGFLSKDKNVTGGTEPATYEANKRVE